VFRPKNALGVGCEAAASAIDFRRSRNDLKIAEGNKQARTARSAKPLPEAICAGQPEVAQLAI